MSVALRERTDYVLYSKGAPEILLNKCSHALLNGEPVPLTEVLRERILAINADLASRALRVLALAFRPQVYDLNAGDLESNLIFVALVGMIDRHLCPAKRPDPFSAIVLKWATLA